MKTGLAGEPRLGKTIEKTQSGKSLTNQNIDSKLTDSNNVP